MARSWKDVRAEVSAEGRLSEDRVAAVSDALYGQVRAYQLAEVRRSQHVTQKVVAAAMGVAQPRVSAIERGEISATEIGTLRSYIEALGGHLRLVADFGDETIVVG